MSELLRLHTHFPPFEKGRASPGLYSLFMRRISCVPLCGGPALYRHSPRTELLLIHRIQSHTHPKRRKFCLKHAGQKSIKEELPEQAKEDGRVPPEGSDTHLGAGGREFESHHSDHLSQKNRLTRRFFCFDKLYYIVRLAAVDPPEDIIRGHPIVVRQF